MSCQRQEAWWYEVITWQSARLSVMYMFVAATTSRTHKHKRACTPSTHSHSLCTAGAWARPDCLFRECQTVRLLSSACSWCILHRESKSYEPKQRHFPFFPREYRYKSNLWWLIMQLQYRWYIVGKLFWNPNHEQVEGAVGQSGEKGRNVMKSMKKLWVEAQSYYHPIWQRPVPAELLAQHY